ncbi:hypothetical protein QBC33DRAFT_235594 [Phialemonium atrogriseum]|uniref:Uncharacterized protein n=1 Tax=Phialemonium atrogriseum TaxID=1093897 RepID=A0AAJ0C6R0_9PEZI|nr:uncharacterized protein QBC33DRAFT_235594 [Phialemonium atrogriseum]KAK1771185.1 hypothetical protein QBC33DRAFT_235594 [Phialemonium atrogriseum]
MLADQKMKTSILLVSFLPSKTDVPRKPTTETCQYLTCILGGHPQINTPLQLANENQQRQGNGPIDRSAAGGIKVRNSLKFGLSLHPAKDTLSPLSLSPRRPSPLHLESARLLGLRRRTGVAGSWARRKLLARVGQDDGGGVWWWDLTPVRDDWLAARRIRRWVGAVPLTGGWSANGRRENNGGSPVVGGKSAHQREKGHWGRHSVELLK